MSRAYITTEDEADITNLDRHLGSHRFLKGCAILAQILTGHGTQGTWLHLLPAVALWRTGSAPCLGGIIEQTLVAGGDDKLVPRKRVVES